MNDHPQPRLHIAGEWRTRGGDRPLVNPASEAQIGFLPQATRQDLEDAVAAAHAALPAWRRTAPAARAAVILRTAEALRARACAIARIVAVEQGKPLAQAHAEVLRCADTLEWDAGEGRRLYGRVIPAEDGMQRMTLVEPVGVVAAFTPWNFPVSAPGKKVGAALAAGCTVVLKAAEDTPASAVAVVEAFVEAGLPAGALNLVLGEPSEISRLLVEHPAVRMISFTGSVPVGKQLAYMAGAQMKPALMELGGHGPVIVCADADPVAAADASVAMKARNAGQICVSPTRFFVEKASYAAFADAFVERAAALRLGDPLDARTEMGPLANARRLAGISDLVEDARARGASILTGGRRAGNSGYFYPLTVIADAPADCRVLCEEPFGPVAVLVPVDDVAQALEQANALPYGLSGYGFTTSAANARRIAEGLQCGNVAINHFASSSVETPFGGVKDSGFGREGGIEGVMAYATVKTVSHKV